MLTRFSRLALLLGVVLLSVLTFAADRQTNSSPQNVGTTANQGTPSQPADTGASFEERVRAVPDAIKSRKAFKREEYFYMQRTQGLGYIPAGAIANAVNQKQLLRKQAFGATANGSAANVVVTGGTWTEIGPKPLDSLSSNGMSAGRVTAIAVDPTNNNIVYMGAADGGVWKTTDGGQNWVPLTDNQASLSIGGIAIAPSAPNTIYVGTGEQNNAGDNYYGIGLLKSTDGGATWTNIPGPFNTNPGGYISYSLVSYTKTGHMGTLVVHPTNANTVFAAASFAGPVGSGGPEASGIYRTTDGGSTWSLVLGGAAGGDVFFDPTNSQVLFASLGNNNETAAGVYKSTDSGSTWTKLTNGLPTTGIGRIALTIAPTNHQALYASIGKSDGTALLGLYRSLDGGSTWTQIPTTDGNGNGLVDYCGGQCWYDNVVAFHPTNPDVLYIGGNLHVYRSTNATTASPTFVDVMSDSAGHSLHVDHHAMVFTKDGSKLYEGNDGGVYSTTTPAGNITWNNLNSTIGTIQLYPGLSIHPTNSSITYAGAQDNGTDMFSGTATWSNIWCGDGGFTAINNQNPSVVYASCQAESGKKFYVYRTSDNFYNTYVSIADSLTAAKDRSMFIPPMIIDPNNGNSLYFGTYRVWHTTDAGTTWTAISPDLTNSTGSSVSSIAVAPSNPAVVYAGSSNGYVSVTSNGQDASPTWTTQPAPRPNNRFVSSIAVDPLSASTAYLTYSGFGISHVYKTIDQGVTWTSMSGDLPDVPVNEIVIDPDKANTFYIGTDIGVFVTTNGGTNWTEFGTGLPNSAVVALKLHRASRTLRAATHGRGVWDLAVPTVAVTVSVTPASIDFGWIDSGKTSSAQTVTVSNTGSTAATLNSIAITGTDFAQTNTCGTLPATLAASTSCTVSVTFSPTDTVVRNATLTVTDADSGAHTVSLTGTGAVPGTSGSASLSASSLTFTSQGVNTTSSAQTITVTNVASTTLTINSVTLTGSDFLMTNGCTANLTLAKSQSCTIQVSFKPAAEGTRPGSISITTSAGTPLTVTLSGTGTAPFGQLNPTNIDFPNQLVTTTSSSHNATLTNSGTGVMNITGMTLTGPNKDDFSIASTTCGSLPATLAAGASCTISLTVKPTAVGVRNATLNVATDAQNSPHTMILSVNGVDFALGIATGSSNTATIAAGGTAGYNLTATGISGFLGDITLNCTGTPVNSTCSVNPTTVTVTANQNSPAFTVSVVTRSQGAATARLAGPALWFSMAFGVVFVIPATRKRMRLALLALALCLIAMLVGCGGGGSHTPAQSFRTPSGTYTVTITGTASGNFGTLSHTQALTLIVQ